MSIGSVLTAGAKNAVSGVLGNVETAMLVIHDYRDVAAKDLADGITPEGILGGQALVRSSVGAVTKSVLTSGNAQSFPDSMDRTMRVKFNPAQLTVNASAVPRSKTNASSSESRTISVEQASLNLTVVLFFDDMDTYDAFLWDKYTASVGTAEGFANLGKAIAKQSGLGKTHTVQYEVESLVAALRNRYTRTITFCWNDFTFTGSLNTVQARYTMFSSSGRPVRAQVLLRILHEMSPRQLSGWYGHFDDAFGGSATDLVRAGQKVGSLLNLNL